MVEKNKGIIEDFTKDKVDAVEIIFFTDPLCCWSFAFENHWQQLLQHYGKHISYRYVMGGLLPDWKSYNDPVNMVTRPAQMGPLWMQTSHVTGVYIKSQIWITDPPVSSYPACIAVKSAELQSFEAAEKYLRLSRNAVMQEEKNISKQDVLMDIAHEVQKEIYSFDVGRFANDLTNGNGLEAFRRDWHQTQMQRIERFPTLILKRKNYRSIMFSGYKSYEAVKDAFAQVAPDLIALPAEKELSKK